MTIKTSMFNLQYLSKFCMDFYATKTNTNAVKRPFLILLIHIRRLHSFRDISENLEVIDTIYPPSDGALVYTNNISRSVYPKDGLHMAQGG